MDSLVFSEMWNLIEQSNIVDTRGEFSNELLIAIFWEESQFKNIEQLQFESGGRLRAVGFGQVQGESMEVVNALYKAKRHHYNRESVLGNNLWSVDLTVDYLRHLRTGSRFSTKRSILCKYAAGQPEFMASAGTKESVDCWMVCEKILLGAKGNFTSEVILNALKAAVPAIKKRGEVPSQIAGGGYSGVLGF